MVNKNIALNDDLGSPICDSTFMGETIDEYFSNNSARNKSSLNNVKE